MGHDEGRVVLEDVIGDLAHGQEHLVKIEGELDLSDLIGDRPRTREARQLRCTRNQHNSTHHTDLRGAEECQPQLYGPSDHACLVLHPLFLAAVVYPSLAIGHAVFAMLCTTIVLLTINIAMLPNTCRPRP